MALDSLLASLKRGVTEVAGVQASRTKAFACNPERFTGVAEGSGVAAGIQTATPETPTGQLEVTAQPAPTEPCTHVTPVTPKPIKCEVGDGDTAITSRWWLIHYLDRDPLEVACCTAETHPKILEWHPDAVAAQPFTQNIRQPSAPMTAREVTDPTTIAEMIGRCRRDADSRDYFTGRAAAELPKPDPFPDDRRTCVQCANLIARRCQAAQRGEIVASLNYEPIGDLPRRCEGYAPGTADTDRRPGRERWPGLIQNGGE